MPDAPGNTVLVQGGAGLSAYEIAKQHGFQGTEQAWLDSLQGATGVGSGFINRGDWLSGSTYNPSDYVFDAGSVWLVKNTLSFISVIAPASDSANWLEWVPAGFVLTTRQINTQHSLQGGGDLSANRTLSLVGDVASPGNSKYYGTDGTGVRGFYSLTAGSGDVVGPASSTDNAIVRFDGTTGKLVQNSAVTIADTTGLIAGARFGNTGLKVEDTAGGQLLTFSPAFNLTADRTLFFNTGDADRTITLNGDTTLSGTNSGDQTITLTGDVTGSGTGSFAATIPNDTVTYAKMQNVSATSRFLGRITAGAGDTEELTGTQATTLLDVFTSGLKGLAPSSGGGTTNFLRADGNWVAPPGGGGSQTPWTANVDSDGFNLLFDDGTGIKSSEAGNPELLLFTSVASAVNELTIKNAATGGSPEISATGGDTDAGILITPKGNGEVGIRTGGNYMTSLVVDNSGSGTNAGGELSAQSDVSSGIFRTIGGSYSVSGIVQVGDTWVIGTSRMLLDSPSFVFTTDGGATRSMTIGSGTITYKNVAAPSSPSSGFVASWADSTDLRFHDKNSAGTIGTTVVADTGASNNFLTAISAAGVISKAQPAFTNLTGDFALTQTPSLSADMLIGRGNGGGAGDWQAITLGTNLSMSGTTLNAAGGGGGGTVTHTAGALTANQLVIGNAADDIKVLGTLGTTTTVLHGNAGGAPTFAAVSLTADVSGDLPFANIAQLAADSIAGNAGSGAADIASLTALPFAFTGDVTRPADSNAQTIPNDTVTYAKMQNVSAASRVLGRGSAGGSGDVEELTLGTNLAMSGTTLNVSMLTGKTIWLDGVNGNDGTGARGRQDLPFLTIGGALGASGLTSGDIIFVRPGSFAAAAATQVVLPAGVHLVGSGINVSTITGTMGTASALVVPGTGSVITGITIDNSSSPTSSGGAIGCVSANTAFTSALIYNCRLKGGIDCFYFDKSGVTGLTVIDCIAESNYDLVHHGTNSFGTLEFYNTTFYADGTSNPAARGINVAHASDIVRVFGGKITVENSAGINGCVTVTAGLAEIHNVRLDMTPDGSSNYHLSQSGGTLAINNCVRENGGVLVTSGTITEWSRYLVRDNNLSDLINAGTARTNLGLVIGTHVQAWDAHLDDLAAIAPAQGDVIYFNGTDWVNLAPGTSGHFLKTLGAGANPLWAAAPGGAGSQTPWTSDIDADGFNLLFDDATGIKSSEAGNPELLLFNSVASAVNELTITNAAAGSEPSISASGGDTNIDIQLAPKGGGWVTIPVSNSGVLPSATAYLSLGWNYSGSLGEGNFISSYDTGGDGIHFSFLNYQGDPFIRLYGGNKISSSVGAIALGSGLTPSTSGGAVIPGLYMTSTAKISWNDDTALYRNAAGVVEVNNGTAGTYRDLKLRDIELTRNFVLPDDIRQTFNPGSTNAGLNVGSLAGDPSAPSNGDLWYDSTANELTARINGANVALGAGGGGTPGGADTEFQYNASGSFGGVPPMTYDGSNIFIDDGTTLRITKSATPSSYFTFDTSALGAGRTVTVPNANSTFVVADTGASNNFLTAISAAGVISKAQPSFTNLSGDFALTQTPSAAADTLIGRGNGGGSGDWQEITLGTGLSMSSTTLNADNPNKKIILTGAGGWGSNTTGAAGPVKVETTTNKQNVQVLDFSDSGTTLLAEWTVVMPADYAGGTITAEFYWMASGTSTNSVVWAIDAVAYSDLQTLDQAFGTEQTVTDAHSSTADQVQVSAATSAVTIANSPGAGDMVQFRVKRKSGDGSDTLAQIARLLAVRINY